MTFEIIVVLGGISGGGLPGKNRGGKTVEKI